MSNSEYITEKRYFPSSDKGKQIYYEIYTKKDLKPKAVIQLAHGMCEYVRRYRSFARWLNDNGYLVVGNDHLGHGMTAAKLAEEKDGVIDPARNEELGYISEKNGWQHCVADMHRLTRIMKKEYPDLPFFMFAHSMGSLLGRAYVTAYPDELDGVVYSGTGALLGTEPQLLLYLQGIKAVKGSRFRPPVTDKAMFGEYGIYNTKAGRDGGGWLNRDADEVIKYMQDPYCTFKFTVNGFDGKIKAKDAVRLINKGSTNLIKGIGKSKKDGKPYDACLVLNPKGFAYVTALKFPERFAERR